MRQFKAIRMNELISLSCDGCGQQASKSDPDFYEFISVNHQCGYSSLHGDGNQIFIDLCQQCFADMCGESLTVIVPQNEEKEWASHFEHTPTVSDDFMRESGNLIAVPVDKRMGKACGMLSDIPINPNINDEASCQSAIDDENDK